MPDPLLTAAAHAIARGSKSFALAARLFDAPTRARATLLYYWCRHCDDVIDDQEAGHGHVARPGTIAERLAGLREATLDALNGAPDAAPPFAALARVANETGLPPRYPFELLDGFAMDAADRRYRTLNDTLDYSYHVAGCVGVMMAIVMGVPPQDRATLERASDLGLAFQLNNIARDVCADADLGRCYLPDEWLADADIPPGEFAKPQHRAALAGVVARLVAEAERYGASARHGTPALPLRSAWAVLSAAAIYGAIGRQVRAAGADAWGRRISTTLPQKLVLVARARLDAAGRVRRWANAPPRDGLWTMPV